MTQYTHRQGQHRPDPFFVPRLWLVRPNVVAYDVRFDQSARYHHLDGYDGINKLFGVDFSVFTRANKGWSYMFGWRWLKDRIQISAYVNHPDGSFVWFPMTSMNIHETARLEIYLGDDGVRWVVRKGGNDFTHTFSQGKVPRFICREIGPWFGGVNPAPHDIKIQMNR